MSAEVPATPSLNSLLQKAKSLAADNKSAARTLADRSNPARNKEIRDGGVLKRQVQGVPHARKGEDPLTSRGYSFLKLFGLISGRIDPEHCKVELGVVRQLQELYDRHGMMKAEGNSFLVPFASDFLFSTHGEESIAQEIRQLTKAGIAGTNPWEARERLLYESQSLPSSVRQKVLSWVDETQGGALVGPPLMGELIELLRNNEVFTQCGARMLAMPPNGRIFFPRQTGPGTAYWVGQTSTITDSTQTTDDVTLTAKKLGILIKVPNELFRFSSISVEQFLREDIARVMALTLDKALLEGTTSGTSVQPKGLINYANINKYTSAGAGTNGDTIVPKDVYRMVSKVESQNAIFKAFIMRPTMWSSIATLRSDSVTAGDQAGPFVFNIIRELQTSFDLTRMQPGNLAGYPVYKSTQISNARTKGSGTNLTYILGGDFTDYVIAMSGSLEFMISTQGDTPFTTDETWFRGIQFCDGAPRREASFVLMDSLIESL